jgi:lauroyl/myristoyl acyltransferase
MTIPDLKTHFDYSVLLPYIAKMPVELAYRLADARGDIIYRSAGVYRTYAERNVSHVFPQLTATEAAKIVRHHYRILSRDEMEAFWYTRSTSFFDRIAEVRGLEALQAASRAGTGALLFSGHLGSTGLFFVILGKKGIEMNIIGRSIEPGENPLHPAVYRYARKRVGWIESAVKRPFLLTGKGNYPRIREKLNRGEIVMLLIDVVPYLLKRTVPVSFLGGAAEFGDGIASLFCETRAPLFQWTIHREGKNYIEIKEITDQVKELSSREQIMHKLVHLLEEKILLHPADWNQWDSLEHFRPKRQPLSALREPETS